MMEPVQIIDVSLILAGAIVMLIGLIRAKEVMDYVPFVPEKHQRHIRWNLMLHRGLMAFFFCGYLVVLASFVFHQRILSETFIGLIFFFGALFVYIGISVQSRLLSGVKTTLKGILPICSSCKKIRTVDGDPEDQDAWKRIEEYISQKSDVAFSHGYCPICFAEEMNKIDMDSEVIREIRGYHP